MSSRGALWALLVVAHVCFGKREDVCCCAPRFFPPTLCVQNTPKQQCTGRCADNGGHVSEADPRCNCVLPHDRAVWLDVPSSECARLRGDCATPTMSMPPLTPTETPTCCCVFDEGEFCAQQVPIALCEADYHCEGEEAVKLVAQVKWTLPVGDNAFSRLTLTRYSNASATLSAMVVQRHLKRVHLELRDAGNKVLLKRGPFSSLQVNIGPRFVPSGASSAVLVAHKDAEMVEETRVKLISAFE